MRNVLGIILGGGQGKRLYPLTKYRSKPAVPLGGKYRLIDIPVSNCINSRIDKIFVLTQFNSASLNRHVNLAFKLDFFREGFVDILAAEQTVENTDWFQGTADAVRKNMRHFRRYRPTHYLILAGDHIYRMDYQKMLEHHLEHNADVTVAVTPVIRRKVSEFGILKVNSECRITEFVEKPKDDAVIESLRCPGKILRTYGVTSREKCFLASMGIYLFKNKMMEEALADQSLTDFGSQIIPQLIKKARVFGYPFSDYWEDIGTIDAFYRANLSLISANPSFDFFAEGHSIYTNPRFLPGSKVHGGQMTDSILTEGCTVKNASITRSIVGLRSIINDRAVIEDSYLMGADYIQTAEELEEDLKLGIPHVGVGKNSRIVKAIIDKNARIGQDVKIGPHAPDENFSGPGYMVKNGITVVEKDAVIAEGMVI